MLSLVGIARIKGGDHSPRYVKKADFTPSGGLHGQVCIAIAGRHPRIL